MRIASMIAALAVAVSLAGCALHPDPAANDPLEPMNRAIFSFNNKVDRLAVKPVAEAYTADMPHAVQNGIDNVLENLDEPVTFGSQLGELRFASAAETVARFVANSTFGIGGLWRVSPGFGLTDDVQDCGLALGSHGIGPGPYLVLPLMGPSNPRDLVGKACTYFLDPASYARYRGEHIAKDVRTALETITVRARALEPLNAIERSSIDYYGAMRSLARQYRENEVRKASSGAP